MATPQATRTGVILAAQDVFALAEFYESTFGFELEQRFTDPPYVILSKLGMRLSFTQHGTRGDDFPDFTFKVDAHRTSGASCLVIEVDNCDEMRQELAAQSISFRSETFRPPWGGARFFCEDPEGNIIEIEEPA